MLITLTDSYSRIDRSRTGDGPLRQLTGRLVAHGEWSRSELLQYQQDLLRKVLEKNTNASPYYRRTISDLVRRGATLEEFPVLSKEQLMVNFDEIVTDRRLCLADIEKHLAGPQAAELLFGQYRVCATGGTSGVRAAICYDKDAWLHCIANSYRFLHAVGVKPSTRLIGIGAPTAQHLSYRAYEELRLGRPDVPRIFVTTPMGRVVEELNKYQPEVITTYPSFIRQLAEEQLKDTLRISPYTFCSVAEALMPEVRELAKRVWGATIVNRFAATETGASGCECEHVCGIHLPEDLVVFESVDECYKPVPTGMAGKKLLITTLTNSVLPLVRYELSDMVTLDSGPCRCGRPFVRMTKIEGRKEELLELPGQDGGRVTMHAIRLLSPLITMAGVVRYQLVKDTTEITIKIVIRDEAQRNDICSAVETKARSILSEVGVCGIGLRVEVVEWIERSGTGAKANLVARPLSSS